MYLKLLKRVYGRLNNNLLASLRRKEKVMARVKTKKFNCDLPLNEFAEVEKVLKKYGETKRQGLLNIVREKSKPVVVDEGLQSELLKSIVEKAQKEINEAYQTVSDLYVDIAAALLPTDREKAIELLKNARDIKIPTISLE